MDASAGIEKSPLPLQSCSSEGGPWKSNLGNPGSLLEKHNLMPPSGPTESELEF